MPVSLDVLNSTLADLKGPMVNTLIQQTPMFKWLEKRKKTSSEKGIYIQRLLAAGSPMQLQAIRYGNETFDTTRTEVLRYIRIATQRFGGALAIPNLDLNMNDGPLGAIKLLRDYPKLTMEMMALDFDRYFLTGVSNGKAMQTAEMTGWLTLNGQKSLSAGITGVTNGLLDFTAPASQTNTVQELAKSTTYNYVNQYGQIVGGYAANGRRVVSSTYRQCARWSTQGGPDIMFADDETYANIEQEDISRVRTTEVQVDIDRQIAKLSRKFLNSELIAAQNLVLSDFTGDAANGVVYMLDSNGFERAVYEEFSISNFADRIANQDNVVAKATGQFALLCTSMATQGTVTGGAV